MKRQDSLHVRSWPAGRCIYYPAWILAFALPAYAGPNELPAPEVGPTVTADRIVAVVEERVITLSELAAEQEIRGIMEGTSLSEAVCLDLMVDEVLIQREEERWGSRGLHKESAADRLARFRAALGTEQACRAFQRRHGYDDDDLLERFSREIRAESYVATRIFRLVNVTEEEIRARISSAVPGWSDLPVESLRARVLEEIRREKAEDRLREWLIELRKKARIEILLE